MRHHSGVTKKRLSEIQELILSLWHAGFEAVQIPFQTAISYHSSQIPKRSAPRLGKIHSEKHLKETKQPLDSCKFGLQASEIEHRGLRGRPSRWQGTLERASPALTFPYLMRGSPSPGPQAARPGPPLLPPGFPHTARARARRGPGLPSPHRQAGPVTGQFGGGPRGPGHAPTW